MSKPATKADNGAHVRPYIPADRDAVLAMAGRMTVGIAPWRDPAAFRAAAGRWIKVSIEGIGPDGAFFIAEDSDRVVGFITVGVQQHFTGEEQAYIGELAVAKAAEGRGIGGALVKAAEDWARSRGLRLITLDTGAANARARRFYTRLGYAEEQVKLVKVLELSASRDPS